MQPDTVKPRIGICVPTFKRPDQLQRLLVALGQQTSDDRFSYSIHVVDNDSRRSAESVTLAFAATAPLPVTYDVEPVQNIALTRNRAVRSATGDFIAFIDDDETPPSDWLLNLFVACERYRADGVLGPVRPRFEPGAPPWLRRSGLCERPSHPTGKVLSHLDTRSGNFLFRRRILDGVQEPFPAEMGRTGGEDMDFFKTMIARGCVFVWCEEAAVYEVVAPERYSRGFYLDKSLRIGGLTGEMVRETPSERWRALFRSIGSLLVYGPRAVAGLLVGSHVSMRHGVKVAYHLGRISGCLGFVPVRYRREQ